jgi:hypothetical protein
MVRFIYSLLAISFLVSCGSENNTAYVASNQLTISSVNFDEVDSINRYEIHLSYPSIDGQINTQSLQQINNLIAESFADITQQTEFISSHKSFGDSLFSHAEVMGSLANNYQVFQADSVLTILFSVHKYYLGAAHGNTRNKTMHFNINSGQLMSFEDFFKTDSITLLTLQQQINQQLPDESCWGIEADSMMIENLSNFFVQTDSTAFQFNAYDLCPYAFGVYQVTLPTPLLQSSLRYLPQSEVIELISAEATGEIASH